MDGAVANSRFRLYVRDLRALTAEAVRSGGLPHASVELAHGHLDGRAGRELRGAVSIGDLRRIGAFFTGERLAQKLVARAMDPELPRHVLDPACGCGDLLLATARCLPITDDLDETLRGWGAVLHGVDHEPEFIDAAHQRLALLAMIRGARPNGCRDLNLGSILRGVRVGDGRRHEHFAPADLVLLNPPYGQVVAPAATIWSSGRITEAALWVDETLAAMPTGARLLAILPDVLRSGSRYARWRRQVRARAEIRDVDRVGQFDAFTDVDVFLVDVTRCDRPSLRTTTAGGTLARSSEDLAREGRAEQPESGPGSTLGDGCCVMVGPVVDRRDPHAGPAVPYITTAELPRTGEFTPTRRRQYEKRLFSPPFVVVRRTSRPTFDEPRLSPVIVRGSAPVAVENHLLVLQPDDDRSLGACHSLAAALSQPAVTTWLNERICLRHLTVGAIREIPTDHLWPVRRPPARQRL